MKCNFLYQITVPSRTPDGGWGYGLQIPVLSVLCPQLNLLNPPQQNSCVRHCVLVYVNTVSVPHCIVYCVQWQYINKPKDWVWNEWIVA